jgi:hypothetical protein
MNSSHLKLFLAVLWLVPGVGFLVLDWWTGQLHALPFAGRQLPLAVPFLLFGAFNLLRWWATRPAATGPGPWRRPARPRRELPQEPDPTFRFDDPPPRAVGDDR